MFGLARVWVKSEEIRRPWRLFTCHKTRNFVPRCAQDARGVGMSAQPVDYLGMRAQTGHRLSEACAGVHKFCTLSGHSTSMKPGKSYTDNLLNPI
jgi:hypothetical protein